MNWKKLWKTLGAALVVTAACAGLAGCGGDSAADQGKTVKLGFLNGTTGGVAAYGLAEKEGFDMPLKS